MRPRRSAASAPRLATRQTGGRTRSPEPRPACAAPPCSSIRASPSDHGGNRLDNDGHVSTRSTSLEVREVEPHEVIEREARSPEACIPGNTRYRRRCQSSRLVVRSGSGPTRLISPFGALIRVDAGRPSDAASRARSSHAVSSSPNPASAGRMSAAIRKPRGPTPLQRDETRPRDWLHRWYTTSAAGSRFAGLHADRATTSRSRFWRTALGSSSAFTYAAALRLLPHPDLLGGSLLVDRRGRPHRLAVATAWIVFAIGRRVASDGVALGGALLHAPSVSRLARRSPEPRDPRSAARRRSS